MGFTTCNTISIYLETKNSLLERIIAIEALIELMILKIADSVSGSNSTVDEYWMDDGQMKVKTSYRSVTDVEMGVKALERMKQMYVNKYNGRSFVLRDASGLNY